LYLACPDLTSVLDGEQTALRSFSLPFSSWNLNQPLWKESPCYRNFATFALLLATNPELVVGTTPDYLVDFFQHLVYLIERKEKPYIYNRDLAEKIQALLAKQTFGDIVTKML
jgi:hypothetical protein